MSGRPLRLLLALVAAALIPLAATPLAAAPVPDRDGTPIEYGDCASGVIAASGQVDAYVFMATAGDVVEVWMTDLASGMASRLEVIAPDDSSLVTKINATQARVEGLVLNATGEYTLLASDDNGLNTGPYGLYLQRTSSPGQATAIAYGDCVQDVVGGTACADTYTFQGTAGDVIELWMSDGASGMASQVEVFAPDGTSLVTKTNANQARVESLVLGTTGEYTILTSDNDGLNTGPYGLYLQRTSSPGQATVLTYGDCTQSSIASRACADTYTFQGTAGDMVELWMSDGASGMASQVEVFAPDGTSLVTKTNANQARVESLVLGTTGEYTILTSDNDGLNTGPYGLYLQRTSSPGQATVLTYGDCTQSSIASRACADTYTFQGTAGDMVELWMTDGASGMASQLEVFAPDGTSLVTRSNATQARIQDLLLGATGEYTILASDNDGLNTGPYGLYLQRTFSPGQATVLTYGDCPQSSIVGRACAETYTFQGTAGDIVELWMTDEASGMASQLEVFAPDGTSLMTRSGATQARIEDLLLGATGEYTVLASDNDGLDTGPYGLYLQRTFSPGQATVLTYGDCPQSSIVGRACAETYTFQGTAGDVIELWMSDGASGMASRLEVFAPDGTSLVTKANPAHARIESLELGDTGVYTILASDDDGLNTGPYGLFLQRTFSPGQATMLVYGDCVQDVVDGMACADTYTFQGVADDVIELWMTDGASGMASQLEVFAPDGTSLVTLSNATQARIQDLMLAATGEYTILASDNDGLNTGPYGLYLQRAFAPGQAAPISYGDCPQGSIDAMACADTYTFQGTDGDLIELWMTDGASGMASRLEVFGPDGTSLVTTSGSTQARIEGLLLRATGEHTILASDDDGQNTGPYGVFLQRTFLPGQAMALDYGDAVQDSIEMRACADTYTFVAGPPDIGDVIRISMTDTASGMASRLELFGPTGLSLQSDADPTQANIDALLTRSGEYTFLASDDDGANFGNYGLSLQRLFDPGSADSIAYGDCVDAAISAVAEVDSYTFQGTAGDLIELWMTDEASGMASRLEVFSPGGTSVMARTNATQARIEGLLLDVSGEYTILASDNDGLNTGPYGLYLQRTFAPGQTVAIAYGDCIQDAIDAVACADAYTFQGTAGDVIELWMSDGASGMASQLEVFAPDGTSLVTRSNAAQARIEELVLGATGEYTILASDNDGLNTGPYGLHLQRTFSPGQATPIAYGDCLTGSITARACADAYVFPGEAGEVVTLWMTDGASGMASRLEVFAPDGSSLAAHAHPTEARIDDLTLGATGEYTILTSDDDGLNTGPYEICLIGGAVGVPPEIAAGTEKPYLRLSGAVPSPFDSSTELCFDLGMRSPVRVAVYSVEGRLIWVQEVVMGPGPQRVAWEPEGLASGVYFYQVTAGPLEKTRRMVLAR